MTNLIGGALCALIAGLLGAALWAAIVFYAEVEIGWIAWGIGAAVGFGASFGSKGGGIVPAIFAVVITVGAIALGKYLAINMLMNQMMPQLEEIANVTDEQAVFSIANELTAEMPNPPTIDESAFEDDDPANDYPKGIWQKANERWNAKPDNEKQTFKDDIAKQSQEALNNFKAAMRKEGFMNAWGGMDVIFVLLGVYTAFQLAFSDPIGNEGAGA